MRQKNILKPLLILFTVLSWLKAVGSDDEKYDKILCAQGNDWACMQIKLHSYSVRDEGDCSKGDQKACVVLGTRISNTDPQKALKLFKAACEKNVQSGCILAEETKYDLGDKVESIKTLLKMCESKNWSACSSLGSLYYYQIKDVTKGRPFFEKACKAEYRDACTLLGFTYDDLEADLPIARTFFQRACDLKESRGCAELGILDRKAGKLADARRNFGKSCELGDNGGCAGLASIEERLGNTKKAASINKKACREGYFNVCYEYPYERYASEKMILKSNDECEKNQYKACWDIGKIEKSKKLMRAACDKGDNEACAELEIVVKGKKEE